MMLLDTRLMDSGSQGQYSVVQEKQVENTNLGIMSEIRTMRKEALISIDWNGRKLQKQK